MSNGGAIGQVWRSHERRANLARFLPGVEVHPIDDDMGRRAGVLLGSAGGTDVIDAAVVLLAHDGDEIYTSGPEDLRPHAQAASRHVDLIRV